MISKLDMEILDSLDDEVEIDTEIETSVNIQNDIHLDILKVKKILKKRELEKTKEVENSSVASARDEVQRHRFSILASQIWKRFKRVQKFY